MAKWITRGFCQRTDGTVSLPDFRFNIDANSYTCPAGKLPLQWYVIPSPTKAVADSSGGRVYLIK